MDIWENDLECLNPMMILCSTDVIKSSADGPCVTAVLPGISCERSVIAVHLSLILSDVKLAELRNSALLNLNSFSGLWSTIASQFLDIILIERYLLIHQTDNQNQNLFLVGLMKVLKRAKRHSAIVEMIRKIAPLIFLLARFDTHWAILLITIMMILPCIVFNCFQFCLRNLFDILRIDFFFRLVRSDTLPLSHPTSDDLEAYY